MTLSTRITILIVATLMIFITVELIILNKIILPAYTTVEEQNGIDDLDRILKALDNEVNHLATSTHDWGAWIDMADFVLNRNTGFIDENLDEVSFKSLDINYMAITSKQGVPIWSNLFNNEFTPLSCTEINLTIQSQQNLIMNDSQQGIIQTPSGPMLIAIRPILKPLQALVGTITMAKFLDQVLAQKISDQTNIQATFLPITTTLDHSKDQLSIKRNGRRYYIEYPINGHKMVIQTVVTDLTGKPALIINISHSLPLVKEGQNAFRTMMISIVIITIVTLLLVLFMIRAHIINPINHLIEQVNKVKTKDVWALSTNLSERNDEVSTLANAFANLVADLHQQRLAIETSEMNYRHLVENANTIILCWNRQGKITLFNEFAQTFFGYSEQEIIGKHVVGTIVPETESTGRDLSPLMDEICQNPEKFKQNINENITATGKVVSVAWTNKVFYNETSGEDEVISIGIDISQRLEHEKLIESAKIDAEQASQFKSLFLANMSHEIRTPMNGIIGMAELLKKAPLPQENRLQLQAIETSAQRLLALINDILDFSRIEAGKLTLEEELFNLQESIADIRVMLDFKANEKKIALKWQINKTIPQAFIGDQYRLSQVIVNLVTNAIKFTEKGTIQVSLNCETSKDDLTSCLHCTVQDTGIGIPKEQQQNIFRAFRQADLSHSRKYAGSGLGLSISSQLIKLMGGEIGLRSSTERGSTFWFKVTLKTSKEAIIVKPKSCLLPEALKGLRILLAEDEAINTMVAVSILEQQQVSVVCVNDGGQVLDQLAENNFDLILMDIQMPIMDGFIATKKIRAKEQQQKKQKPVPIIAMTAHAIKGYREKCIKAGMNDYISKPFNHQDLLDVIAKNVFP